MCSSSWPTARSSPRDVLDVPRLGIVNLHFSLLPRWRGASPGPAGDPRGRRGHRRDRDAAWTRAWTPARCSRGARSRSGPTTTPGRSARASRRSARDARRRDAPALADGTARRRQPQTTRRRRSRPSSRPEERVARLDASPADAIVRRVRAFAPDPGARTTFRGNAEGAPRRDRRGAPVDAAGARSGRGRRATGVRRRRPGDGTCGCSRSRRAGRAGWPAADWARGARDLRRRAVSGDDDRAVGRARGDPPRHRRGRLLARGSCRRCSSGRAWTRATGRSRPSSRTARSATSRGLDRAIGLRASRPVDAHEPRRARRAAARRVPAAVHAASRRTPRCRRDGRSGHARERGFVNAVLRTLADEPPAAADGRDRRRHLGAHGLAPWAVQELRLLLGDDEAEVAAEAFGERGRSEPAREHVPDDRSTRSSAGSARAGTTPQPAQLDPDCVLLDGGDPARLPGFAQGWFAVQDQASAFVVGALDPQPGDRVLDACAAPGGKAAHAACIVGETGRRRARRRCARSGRPSSAGTARAARRRRARRRSRTRARPALDGPFDRVLVDAPCSGIGSARRRPELLWRPRRGDLSHARPAPGRDRVRRRRSARARRPPRLLGVHVPARRDRRRRATRSSAIGPSWSPWRSTVPDGPSARVRLWPHRHGSRRHVRRGLPRNGPERGRVR